jgi:predicted dienelactone hydrolase
MPSNNNTCKSAVIFRTKSLLLAVFIISISLYGSLSQAAGFRDITTKGVQFGVWYPTDTVSVQQRLGPFKTSMSKDAPVLAGKHPIVLFSHGNGGRFRNHYLTAQALADAGYIVIAPQHQADYLVGSRKTAAALNHRYLELKLSLNALRSILDFSTHIAPGPVHGVGYSLGGATIMLAAGAGFDSKEAAQHCEKNGVEDAVFCESPGFIFRMIQSFRSDVNLRSIPDSFRNEPIVNGKAVVIAPVYQGFTFKSGLSLTELTVIAITGETIAQPRFHAERLEQIAGVNVPSQLKTIVGHHYAFISPFPKWLTDQEDIPVAKDPAGFDRLMFLAAVNEMILGTLGKP